MVLMSLFPVLMPEQTNPSTHTVFTDSTSLGFRIFLCTEFKLATIHQVVFIEVRSHMPSFPELALSHLLKATTITHQYK